MTGHLCRSGFRHEPRSGACIANVQKAIAPLGCGGRNHCGMWLALRSGLALGVLLALAAVDMPKVAARAAIVPAAAAVPPLPSWARETNALASYAGGRNMMFMYNQKLVADANATGTMYDVAFMGDSVIAYTVVVPAVAAVWDRFWAPSTGLKAARLGVGCSTVEELVWRMMANGEKFAQDPKVVVLLVGINNSLESKPWKALEFLVDWMRVAMPRTKVLILSPLPNFLGTSDTFRVQYRRVARRCPQCTFSTCGSTLNWRSHKLYMDPAHPNARGYTIVWNCLKPAVLKLLKTT